MAGVVEDFAETPVLLPLQSLGLGLGIQSQEHALTQHWCHGLHCREFQPGDRRLNRANQVVSVDRIGPPAELADNVTARRFEPSHSISP